MREAKYTVLDGILCFKLIAIDVDRRNISKLGKQTMSWGDILHNLYKTAFYHQ